MLKQGFSWILYGDWRELLPALILSFFLVGFCSYSLLYPWQLKLNENHNKIRDSELQLSRHLNLISQLSDAEPIIVPVESLGDFAVHFDLAAKHQGEFWYVSGSTQDLIFFLQEAYALAYPIQEFSLKKSSYKTVLVIRL